MVQFRLASLEEELAIKARAEEGYDNRHRVQCLCGRFARMGRDMGRDMNGEYNWTVHCKKHGEVWIS